MRWANGNNTTTVWLAVVAGVLTGGSAWADFTFGQRVNLGPVVNSPYGDYSPFIAPDGLSLYFASTRPGGFGQEDIWVSTRATVSDPWGPPVNLGAPVNSEHREGGPSITADGLTLIFSTDMPGGLGGSDIWLTTRPTKESPWDPPVNLGSPVNSAGDEICGCITPDGRSLYFSTVLTLSPTNPDIVYGGDIYITTRATRDSPWEPPLNLGLMPSRNGSANWGPRMSADALALFFFSDYADVSLLPDIWLATRTRNDSGWGTPILLGPEINTRDGEQEPSISADGSTLYWSCGRAGPNTWDLWQSTISPVVDLNADGIVDGADINIMVDHWGQDSSLCDIGPMPWGDGVVDIEDLKVLAEYIGEVVDDPTLVAHWRLDESEGMTAYDSAGVKDGTVMGIPAWQPDGGQVGGALEFDGVTFVVAGSVLDPSDGPFSVLAWVKGGAPGQVIVSQEAGADWLLLDPATGVLMTELKSGGRSSAVLYSDAIITDGTWHRVAFAWDGSSRRLYVDGVLVAEDTQDGLTAASGNLTIGAGATPAADTYWTGLIDDVRIYSRAVKP